MKAEPVDPSNVVATIVWPTYRVYFWQQQARPAELAHSRPPMAMQATEWRLTSVRDVHEALAWADENKGGARFEVFVETIVVDGTELTRLAGFDPTQGFDVAPAPYFSLDAEIALEARLQTERAAH